jgi:hypothetical protein
MDEVKAMDEVHSSAPIKDFKEIVIKNGKQVIVTISPEDAHENTETIGLLVKEMSIRAFEIGARCYGMMKNNGWAYNWDSLNEYIASLGFGRRHFFNFIRLHRLWTDKIINIIDKCSDVLLKTTHTKLLTVVKHLEQAEDDEQLLSVIHDAHSLSLSDLQKAYGKKKTIMRGIGKLLNLIEREEGKSLKIVAIRNYWTNADSQVWWEELIKSGGQVKLTVEAVDWSELNEE